MQRPVITRSRSFRETVGGAFVHMRARRSKIAVDDGDQASLTSSSEADSVEHGVSALPIVEETAYTLGDHAEYLQLRKDIRNNYFCDIGHMMTDSNMTKLVKDYVRPIPYDRLNSMYFGLERKYLDDSLPVRTMSLRLRPDIMSNIVMDAVQSACEDFQDMGGHVLNRFDGRLQCLLMPEDDLALPFVLDASICTCRTGAIDRHLLIRVFHVGDEHSSKINKNKGKRRGPKKCSTDDVRFPVNLFLKDASSFLQYIEKQSNGGANVMDRASPRDSPKATTAFMESNYDPTVSVQMSKKLMHTNHAFYPFLNTTDWSLIQSSWNLMNRIWKGLLNANSLFHTISTIPLVTKEDKGNGPVLDLHYCSQIRQMSRHSMVAEVETSMKDLQENLDNTEEAYENFLKMLQPTWAKFKMAQVKSTTKPSPKFALPPKTPPPGFTILAAMACKCAKEEENDPSALCDDATRKVYKTFCSQDDHFARKYLKESNQAVMERLVEIQKVQRNLVEQLEYHANCQNAGKQFVKSARQATNADGRVDRVPLTRVPLLDFQIIGGTCQITATCMLVMTKGVFGSKVFLFDLRAVDFQVVNDNCIAVLKSKTRQQLCRIKTSTDVKGLELFLSTLLTLQSVFALNPETVVLQDMLDESDDEGDLKC